MNVLSIILVISGVTVGILSGGATFFNKQRYTAQIDLLQAGNDELRNQNKDLRDKQTDLVAQLAAADAREEKNVEIIATYKRQPNFAALTKLISTNHKEIMTALQSYMEARHGK